MLIFSAVLVCCINSALSGITTTPGIQRKVAGDTANFQWSVTGPISSYRYSVYNQTLGNSGPLNANADYIMDNRSGVVILIISNVQLSDAGNYSLSVTTGATTQINAGALLFVYGGLKIFVNQTSGGSGQQPATEGDAVELTCTAISTSLPVAYRPKVIYYQWYVSGIGFLKNISSGQATLAYYGHPVPGYSIKNDGRTLVIASVQYRGYQGIRCYGQEHWSPHQNSSNWLTLRLKYRPHVTQISPASRKVNAIVGDHVSLSFNFEANPDVTSATNWSFINSAGHAQDLPIGFSDSSYYSSHSLTFTLTSKAYHGNYSITLNNSIGTTTETFQVFDIGLPDAPWSVRATFVSHYLIAIAWNCIWFNGRQQTTFVQLRALYNDSVIDTQATSSSECHNHVATAEFRNGIQSETDYEVRVWSTNNLGSSDLVKLTIKTPKIFKFFVSPRTISCNGNRAIVNFRATEGKIARLDVSCCLEITGNCYWNTYYNVNRTAGQITIDNLQSACVYIFGFTVYGDDASGKQYFLTMVKGVRVSRNREADEPDDEKPDDEKPSPLPVAVIVFAVLLGVAVLALIGCIIVLKRRHKSQPSHSQQKQPRTTGSTRAPQPATQPTNKAYEDEGTYEAVDVDNETHYTALEGQRRR